MKRNNLIHSKNETFDENGMSGIDNNNDYEKDSFLKTSPSNHSQTYNNNAYNNITITSASSSASANKDNDRFYRNDNNQNHSYNPVLQTNFDLNPITSSTKAATSYMDEMEVIQTIGTTHSRKGKYIPSTWKKNRRIKKLICAVGACFILLFLYSASRSSSSSSSSKSLNDENHSSGAGDTDNNKNHYFHHGDNVAGEGGNVMGGEYAHLQINDYTNLNPKIIHSSSHTQNAILKKITKSCLKQSQWEQPSQEQVEMICSHPKCTIQNPFLGEGYEQSSLSWNKALDMNIGLIENYLSKSYTNNHDGSDDGGSSYSHVTDDGIIDEKYMLDVVFYGDSIIEQWNGRWMGNEMTSKSKITSVYRRYFDPFLSSSPTSSTEDEETEELDMEKNDSDSYSQNNKSMNMDSLKGLALGIAGDKTTNLLYRLQKGGELPDELQSKAYWLLIGTNDLTQNCSEDIVILGILSIVQEIRLKKPNSIVVINGLLPRTDDADGRLISTTAISNTNDLEGQSETSSGSSLGDEIDVDTQEEAPIISSPLSTTNSSSPSSTTSNSSSHYNNIRHYQKERHETSNVGTKNNSPIFNYWPSIEAINYQLKLYAEKHDKVEYFDPSHLFLAQMGNEFYKRDDEQFLMKELQDDFLHPTAFGHEIWAKAIVDYFYSDLDTPENLSH